MTLTMTDERILAPNECRALLRSHDVGRLMLTDHRPPDVLPVNYSVDGAELVLNIAAVSALERLMNCRRVWFLIGSRTSAREWSVIVRGRVTSATLAFSPRPVVVRVHADAVAGQWAGAA